MTKRTINIHGKEYMPVNERVQEAHDDNKAALSITTECVSHAPVVFKATVVTKKGTFTGYSFANPAKSIEKSNPYEVAETSAVGRALGFAGYGIVESIASADEMNKVLAADKPRAKVTASMANVGNGACIECHAPAGKNHATSCTLGRGEQSKTIGHMTEPM